MSDMKCPFCNGELVGTIGHPICRNQDCVMCDDPMPQDLLEELIYTRKALDIAINAIESAKDHNVVNCVVRGVSPQTDDVHVTLYKALDEIKIILKQKDIK